MQIKNATFITSFANADKYAEYAEGTTFPEICVAGRSNVGKSTFINTLAKRNKLAKTSSSPGRTRLVNIFDFNDGQFRLVDLPGYGYALASKTEREKWGDLIEGYLQRSPHLKHTLVLVDSRHAPQKTDVDMVNYLYYYRMPFTVIATKCDKLSKAEIGRSMQTIATTLKIGRDNIIAVSQEGYGMEKVTTRIEEILSQTPTEE